MELLGSVGFSIVAFIFVLGVMIFIHELGHCMVAKYLGIRVEVFSLGFGPRLIGFRRGDTDYIISAIPLGGYVKMAGENPDEDLKGTGDEFLTRPKSHRFAVAIAGPAMNIGLAVVLLMGQYMWGIQSPAFLHEPATVGFVEPDSAAELAGLQVMDVIVAINGDFTPTWRHAEIAFALSGGSHAGIAVNRGGQRFETQLLLDVVQDRHLGGTGIEPFWPFVIREVSPGLPAEQSGLLPGDEVLKVEGPDGSTAVGFPASQQLISRLEGQPLRFTVSRNQGQEILEKDIRPVSANGHSVIGTIVERPTRLERYGPLEALKRSIERNYEVTVLVFSIIGKMVTGQTSVKNLSGPIEIARYSGVAASAGLASLIGFMALISLQLGIFNLLPIPILDGGVIALLGVEAVLGRDLSMKVKERIFQVGFIFLILLMGFVIFNDLTKNIPLLQ